MALTRIEYGALASSETVNNNFDYLNNQIGDLSDRLTSNIAGVLSNIASINSAISALQEDFEARISALEGSNE